jgi:eukaryotic-like serine/threonine-protein kinase
MSWLKSKAKTIERRYSCSLVRGEVYFGSRTKQPCRRVSEDSRSQRHRLELLGGALSFLEVARANALQSRTSNGSGADAGRVRALAAYKAFLTLWKDADPDVPILKEANVEYPKLQ